MRLRAIALVGALTLVALFAPAAQGGPAEDYTTIKQDWVARGADAGPGITPCKFRQEQIASARVESQKNLDDNYTGFRDALTREYSRQQAGACTPVGATQPAIEVIPKPDQAIKLPKAKKCISRKLVRIKFVRPSGSPVVKRIQVFLDGKSVKVVQGFVPTATVKLKKLPTKRFTFKVVLTYASGKKLTTVRKYKPCTKRKTKPKRPKR